MEFVVFKFVPLVFFLDTTKKRLAKSSLFPSHQLFIHIDEVPLSLLFSILCLC